MSDQSALIERWAAFNSWRGHPKQFAQLARRALALLDGGATCRISLIVKEDLEFFASPDELLEQASPQALAQFSAIRIDARCGATSVTLDLTRESRRSPWSANRGVSLRVEGTDHAAVNRVYGGLVPAVRRGQFCFTRQPRDQVMASLEEELTALDRRRNYRAIGALAFVAAVAGMATLLVFTNGEGVAFALLGVVVATVALVLLAEKKAGIFDSVFPIVEIAETTSGKRYLAKLSAVPLVPVASFVIKAL